MKKSILFLFLLSAVSAAFGQLVNPSFENWTSFNSSGGPGEYPTGWTTTDSVGKANGGTTSAFKDTDAYDGNFSLHLKTSSIIFIVPIKSPAIATNGLVNFVGGQFIFSGGSADTSRARYYSGQYKYSQAALGDSGQVSVFLLKRNGSNRDTIAVGSVSLTSASTYQQFMVMMNYRDFVQQPDTTLILIQSSIGGLNYPNAAINSELVVDSINAFGFVGVEELSGNVKAFDVYPSPATDHITLDAELKNPASLSYDIFDNNGRWIRTAKLNSPKENVDITDLPTGNYVLKLNSEGKVVTARKFAVSR